MKTVADPDEALLSGLARLRANMGVPAAFPPEVEAAAASAAARRPADHVDRTDRPFVTLDPATSTDLDQAFHIERSGEDLLLHYAIADIGWFVEEGDLVDAEAWRRGATIYLPDGKASLYPPSLSEAAASLLPAGPRPAVVFTVRIAADGGARLDAAERALIHSRAKLAYDSVREADLPDGFVELAARVQAAEARRGAARVDPPEQEVERLDARRFRLMFRPRLVSETRNAALSLAANLAIADCLLAHRTGLFRVMPGPDAHAIARLRLTAQAIGVPWPGDVPLEAFVRTLDGNDPQQAAFMLAVRRSGNGAAYAPYRDGPRPWHAAMAASYAHATAPLRRLADRYVVAAALALARGEPISTRVTGAFEKLPAVMARAEALGSRIERAVIDLAEAVMLQDREGEIFCALVTDADERGARLQLCDLPVVTRVAARGARPGDRLHVRLVAADPQEGTLAFERVEQPDAALG